jgi:hypothetical protein
VNESDVEPQFQDWLTEEHHTEPHPDANRACVCDHVLSEHEGGWCKHHHKMTNGFDRWMERCTCKNFQHA